VLFRHLQRHQDLIMGTGVVIAPGLLADAPMWLEWWRAGPGETPSALKLDLDPTSLGFYDYTQAEWYVAPSGGSSRAVVGPFVDFGGTNEYTLAVTVPVTSAGVIPRRGRRRSVGHPFGGGGAPVHARPGPKRRPGQQ
jgi:hypothetical protein